MALGAGVAGVGLWLLVDSYDAGAPTGREAGILKSVVEADDADEPFAALTETHVEVGGRRLRVVVADDVGERSQGLRQRTAIGAYDGMLFVYPEPVKISFTMSTVLVPLDIAFYAGDGRVVSRLRMEPCADAEARCPSYRADGAFQYALETLAGELPEGRLAATS